MTRDEEAFESLMRARRLPRNNDEEIAVRQKAIAQAIQEAAEMPLAVACRAVEVLWLAREVAENGNSNAITDAGSAATLAWTALKAAGLNVKINASGAPDPEKAKAWLAACEGYEIEAQAVFDEIKAILKMRAGLTFGHAKTSIFQLPSIGANLIHQEISVAEWRSSMDGMF